MCSRREAEIDTPPETVHVMDISQRRVHKTGETGHILSECAQQGGMVERGSAGVAMPRASPAGRDACR